MFTDAPISRLPRSPRPGGQPARCRIALFAAAVLCAAAVPAVAQQAGETPDPAGTTTTMEQRLQRLEQQLGSDGLLSLAQELAALRNTLRELNGQVEKVGYELLQLQEQQRSAYKDLDERLRRAELARDERWRDPDLQIPEPQPDNLVSQGSEQEQAQPDDPVPNPGQAQQLPYDPPVPVNPEQEGTVTTNPVPPGANEDEASSPGEAAARPPLPGQASEAPAAVALASPEPEPEPDPIMAKADYDKAFNLLRQGHYQQAVTAFRDFLERHPQDAQAANAEYWTGEAYYMMQRHQEAILHIGAFLQHYPQNRKYAQALYKLAMSHLLLGDRQSAHRLFQDVLRRFPRSPAADLSRRQLDESAGSETDPETSTPGDSTPSP